MLKTNKNHNIIRHSSQLIRLVCITVERTVIHKLKNAKISQKKIKKKNTIKLNKTLIYLNELKTYKLGGVEQFQIRFDIQYTLTYIQLYVDIIIGKLTCVYSYIHTQFIDMENNADTN